MSMYIHARVSACVCVCVYRLEGQVLILWMVWFVVCTSVFVLVVAISPLPCFDSLLSGDGSPPSPAGVLPTTQGVSLVAW